MGYIGPFCHRLLLMGIGRRSHSMLLMGIRQRSHSPPLRSAEGRLPPKGRKKGRGQGWGL
ncbi:MAG: hypothetical protein IJ176_08130 [Prevotella sp.]|nr:hypothetical protein [Prevotella sp.]